MNAILERMLATGSVTVGDKTLPLCHPDFPSLAVHMDAAEGAFLADEGGVARRREAAVEPVRVDVAVDAGETDCKEEHDRARYRDGRNQPPRGGHDRGFVRLDHRPA